MGCLEQHKEALFRRAGEEEKRLFYVFIWLFDVSFTWPFSFRLFGGAAANFAAVSDAAFAAAGRCNFLQADRKDRKELF